MLDVISGQLAYGCSQGSSTQVQYSHLGCHTDTAKDETPAAQQPTLTVTAVPGHCQCTVLINLLHPPPTLVGVSIGQGESPSADQMAACRPWLAVPGAAPGGTLHVHPQTRSTSQMAAAGVQHRIGVDGATHEPTNTAASGRAKSGPGGSVRCYREWSLHPGKCDAIGKVCSTRCRAESHAPARPPWRRRSRSGGAPGLQQVGQRSVCQLRVERLRDRKDSSTARKGRLFCSKTAPFFGEVEGDDDFLPKEGSIRPHQARHRLGPRIRAPNTCSAPRRRRRRRRCRTRLRTRSPRGPCAHAHTTLRKPCHLAAPLHLACRPDHSRAAHMRR